MPPKELIEYLMQRDQVETRCIATVGYDLPPYATMTDFKIWEAVEPPKGTVHNYPIRPCHDQAASPTAMHNQRLARLKESQIIPQVIAWAKDELEGFLR